jgi:hypothetical protein
MLSPHGTGTSAATGKVYHFLTGSRMWTCATPSSNSSLGYHRSDAALPKVDLQRAAA